MFGLVWAGCKEKPERWQKLAEATNAAGQRFVVAQQHYDFVEGWRVGFWCIDSDEKLYGSLLEMETGRWREVRLVQTNEMVEVWRGAYLAGKLDLSERTFRNALNGVVDEYVESVDGAQGTRATNSIFDGP
jgi:hypothetical protein